MKMPFNFEMKTKNSCDYVEFKWTIANFTRLASSVESPAFCPIPGIASKWAMLLEFKPENGINQMFVSFKSLDKEGTCPPMRVEGRLRFLNNKNSLWVTTAFNIVLNPSAVVECSRGPKSCLFPLPICIREYFPFPDDLFIITCHVNVSGILTSSINRKNLPSSEAEEEDILSVIYKKNSYTDFTFLFPDGELKVHKSILSARSKVFAKWFEQEHKNFTAIEDFEFCVFESFVGFLYTRTINDDVKQDLEKISSLYDLSQVYDVKDLRQYCSYILASSHLSVNTVIHILKFACLYHDFILKADALMFFRNKFSEVAETEEYRIFLDDSSRLASEAKELVNSVTTSTKLKELLV